MEYSEPKERAELDDISMIKYYSPQYAAWVLDGLEDRLEDVYSSAASRIEYEDYNIRVTSTPVDILVMRSMAIKNQIQNFERAYSRHRGNLDNIMKHCTPIERRQFKDYLVKGFIELLKVSFNPDNLPQYPIVHRLKNELYDIERIQRKHELVRRRTRTKVYKRVSREGVRV